MYTMVLTVALLQTYDMLVVGKTSTICQVHKVYVEAWGWCHPVRVAWLK